MTLVACFQPLTYVTKNSIVNVVGVVDPPLKSDLTFRHKINLCFYLLLRTLLYYVVLSVPSSLVCSYVLVFHTNLCRKFKDEIVASLNNFC